MGSDDIVALLRAPELCICVDAVLANCSPCNARIQAADEIERLQRWKVEATAVLNRWDSLCGRTLEVVRIGDRKSDAMAAYIESQKAEIERLRAAIETYVVTVQNCYCTPEMERAALETLKEARRG